MDDLRTVRVGAVRLAYRVWGRTSARPVVLLHCLGADGTDWDPVAAELAADHRVYAVDLPGHGGSYRSGQYALERVRDDVAGCLRALGLTGVALVGHSYGGVIAYLLAQEHPELVGRLVIEDAPPLFRREAPLAVPQPPDEQPDLDWEVMVQFARQRTNPDPRWVAGLSTIIAPTLVVAGGSASHVPQDLVADLAARMPD
jgi:pimeloyl-ACP methyl ester carboxylesterase